MRSVLAIALFASPFLAASPALALCSTATLEDDYRQADVVVRARVVAETTAIDDEPSAVFKAQWGEYSPVTLHRLRVIEVFKGRPGQDIRLFQTVDSGRYAIGIQEEHLLFFTYYRPNRNRPAAAQGAMYVRHTCGMSKPWAEVSISDTGRLRNLTKHR